MSQRYLYPQYQYQQQYPGPFGYPGYSQGLIRSIYDQGPNGYNLGAGGHSNSQSVTYGHAPASPVIIVPESRSGHGQDSGSASSDAIGLGLALIQSLERINGVNPAVPEVAAESVKVSKKDKCDLDCDITLSAKEYELCKRLSKMSKEDLEELYQNYHRYDPKFKQYLDMYYENSCTADRGPIDRADRTSTKAKSCGPDEKSVWSIKTGENICTQCKFTHNIVRFRDNIEIYKRDWIYRIKGFINKDTVEIKGGGSTYCTNLEEIVIGDHIILDEDKEIKGVEIGKIDIDYEFKEGYEFKKGDEFIVISVDDGRLNCINTEKKLRVYIDPSIINVYYKHIDPEEKEKTIDTIKNTFSSSSDPYLKRYLESSIKSSLEKIHMLKIPKIPDMPKIPKISDMPKREEVTSYLSSFFKKKSDIPKEELSESLVAPAAPAAALAATALAATTLATTASQKPAICKGMADNIYIKLKDKMKNMLDGKKDKDKDTEQINKIITEENMDKLYTDCTCLPVQTGQNVTYLSSYKEQKQKTMEILVDKLNKFYDNLSDYEYIQVFDTYRNKITLTIIKPFVKFEKELKQIFDPAWYRSLDTTPTPAAFGRRQRSKKTKPNPKPRPKPKRQRSKKMQKKKNSRSLKRKVKNVRKHSRHV
jgi:hypothetical protein